MLASTPASILNQNYRDLGIPNRFCPKQSGSNQHPRIGKAELDYIERGGALINMDPVEGEETARNQNAQQPFKWDYLRQLVSNRMMLGIYLGQYCINTLTFFFITWFPVYLVQQRGMSILNAGMVASVPAICGFLGGVLGGVISDFILRRGWSLTVARKTPIVAGMLLSTSMVICNYVDAQWLVVARLDGRSSRILARAKLPA